MEKYGKQIDHQMLQFERLLPGPIERVWHYITDAQKRSEWFCGGTSGINPGNEMQFEFRNSELGEPSVPTPDKYKEFGDGFVSTAVVLESKKPNLFVIEWDGIVRFELTEVGAQVKLVLTHEKIKDDPQTRNGALAGWHTHLGVLMDVLHNVTPKSFWTVHMSMEEEYKALYG